MSEATTAQSPAFVRPGIATLRHRGPQQPYASSRRRRARRAPADVRRCGPAPGPIAAFQSALSSTARVPRNCWRDLRRPPPRMRTSPRWITAWGIRAAVSRSSDSGRADGLSRPPAAAARCGRKALSVRPVDSTTMLHRRTADLERQPPALQGRDQCRGARRVGHGSRHRPVEQALDHDIGRHCHPQYR